jgi:hypothetical protein
MPKRPNTALIKALAEFDRDEDLRIVAFDQQRHILASLVEQAAQLRHIADRLAVQREDDVAGQDAGARSRSADVFDQQPVRIVDLPALFRGQRTKRQAESRFVGRLAVA